MRGGAETARDKTPKTAAIRVLNRLGAPYTARLYDYVDRGGTKEAARQLEVEEHGVIKTLVFETDRGEPLIVLMHGDRTVSTKQLARALDLKSVVPIPPASAQKITGYQVGGISPFGTTRPVRVYMEESILDLPRILINGGKRGLLIEMSPRDVADALEAVPVRVGLE